MNVNDWDQPNSRFHDHIFCEIGRRLWKVYSSVKSRDISRFSVNYYQFSFIYKDFLPSYSQNDILDYVDLS